MITDKTREKLDTAIALQAALSFSIESAKDLMLDTLLNTCVEKADHIKKLLEEVRLELEMNLEEVRLEPEMNDKPELVKRARDMEDTLKELSNMRGILSVLKT